MLKKSIIKHTPDETNLAIQNDEFLNLVKENQPVSSKAKLLELAATINIDKKSAESLITKLKERDVLHYSKSTPKGWSAN